MMAARKKAVKVAQAETLLVELLTEELPPKSLQRLSEAFAQGVLDGLRANAFIADGTQATPYATPRRLALTVPGVLAVQPDRVIERKGPAVSAGFDSEGKPTPALIGFAKSCGVTPEKLERRAGDKGEQFVHISAKKGEPLAGHLAAIVEAALKKLPVAKLMRWGDGEAQFVRPVHGVILLHGSKVVPGTVLGLKSGNKTLGHRFLSRGALSIPSAEKYEATLRSRGKVIARFEDRHEAIERGLRKAVSRDEQVLPDQTAATTGDVLARNLDLITEVAALVEWPKVYVGRFDTEFLAVPPECLALSMQSHQRYFPVVARKEPARLVEKFLVVSNIEIRDARNVIRGNERVLRARLSDARFFFDQDRKHKLEERVPKLASVVYHNKLGTQLERVGRLEQLACELASLFGLSGDDTLRVARAARLCKADLLTDMVGEFPELQGTTGYYYARGDGEDTVICEAIRDHYRPRFANDVISSSRVATCLALADRLETIVGLFGVGERPTGEKDPFGLRRAALGIIRILLENPAGLPPLKIPLLAVIGFTERLFENKISHVREDVWQFILDRFRPDLREKGFRPDEIESVLADTNRTNDIRDAARRIEAVRNFRRLAEAESLAAANKRIRNILKQAGGTTNGAFDPALAAQDEERVLGERVDAIKPDVELLFTKGDYEGGLKKLASLRPAVDAFFDKVLVMHEDEAIRKNRLALLTGLSDLFLGVADISRLQS